MNTIEQIEADSSATVRKSGGNGEIVVAFGIDHRFIPHLAVTIKSIVGSAQDERFHFVVAHDGVGDEARRLVESCASAQQFDWHQVDDERLLKLSGRGYVSRATYYRLYLPQIAPADARRLIYLDADVVVCRSLHDLWQSDLHGRVIGAVFDGGVDSLAFARQHNLPEQRLGYFNAGVLLMDIARIRDESLFAPVFDFLANCAVEPSYHDQDALNVAFWGKWQRLDPMWNLQRRFLMRSSGPCYPEDSDLPRDRRPKILHFTEDAKPWVPRSIHPYMWAYFRIAAATPYGRASLKASDASRIKLLWWRIIYVIFRLFPRLAYEPHRNIESWRVSLYANPGKLEAVIRNCPQITQLLEEARIEAGHARGPKQMAGSFQLLHQLVAAYVWRVGGPEEQKLVRWKVWRAVRRYARSDDEAGTGQTIKAMYLLGLLTLPNAVSRKLLRWVDYRRLQNQTLTT